MSNKLSYIATSVGIDFVDYSDDAQTRRKKIMFTKYRSARKRCHSRNNSNTASVRITSRKNCFKDLGHTFGGYDIIGSFQSRGQCWLR